MQLQPGSYSLLVRAAGFQDYNQNLSLQSGTSIFATLQPVAPVVVPAPVKLEPLISKGSLLSWSTSAGQNGSMRITALDGLNFEVDQTNDQNRGAGIVKLYGAIADDGRRVVLFNIGQWKEIWDGTISGNEIDGKMMTGSASYTFKIGPANAPAASTAPFVNGKTLRWETNAAGGQNGTIYVTSAKGTTFNLDQKNNQNMAAGVTKLDGEIKNGQIYIYNRQWGETWVGTLNNGTVTGTINNSYSFKIYE